MKNKFLIIALFVIPLFAACSSLVVKPVNYGWPIENVLTTDGNGMVEEKRHSISFNAAAILKHEFGDSTNVDSKEIRIIRNNEGYYIITAQGFNNVYLFAQGAGLLNLEKKYLLSEVGLKSPIMNQRNTYIELIDGESIYEITSKGFTKR